MTPRQQIVVGLLAAFLLGTTLGLVSAFALMRAHRPPRLGPPPFAGAGPGAHPMLDRVVRELDLTDAQRARFHEVLGHHRVRFDAVRESTRLELERVLDDRQRARFRELEARLHPVSRRPPPGADDPSLFDH